jgi:hypothetical protein
VGASTGSEAPPPSRPPAAIGRQVMMVLAAFAVTTSLLNW